MGRVNIHIGSDMAKLSTPSGKSRVVIDDSNSESSGAESSDNEAIDLVVQSAVKPKSSGNQLSKDDKGLPKRRLFEKVGAKEGRDGADGVADILSNMSLNDKVQQGKQKPKSEPAAHPHHSSKSNNNQKQGNKHTPSHHTHRRNSASPFSPENSFQKHEREKNNRASFSSDKQERRSKTKSERNSFSSENSFQQHRKENPNQKRNSPKNHKMKSNQNAQKPSTIAPAPGGGSGGGGFFEKLHAPKQPHPQKQDTQNHGPQFGQTTPLKNSLAAQAGLRPNLDHRKKAQAHAKQQNLPPKTFNSPVKSFNSKDGAFMEIMTPKSNQWGQRTDINALKNHGLVSPSKNFFGSSNDQAYPSGGNQWGIRGGPNLPNPFAAAKPGRVSAMDFHNAPKGNTTDAIKDLIESFGGDEDAETSGVSEVDGLLVKLLPHQTKGLEFLLKREGPKVGEKGGFLCDDMGLGKTVQSLALILSNPLSKQTETNFAENQAKSTLVIAPLALATQWAQEVQSKAPGLSVCVHHGQNRTKSSSVLEKHDVVVTTFQLVTSEAQNEGPLTKINWYRIIVDEAHTIKNRKSKSAEACCSLKSVSRWCLTGTPIQNNIEELYSLIKFLQIKPYNHYASWSEGIGNHFKAGRTHMAMKRLHIFLSMVMLRRTKKVLGQSGINLPERNIHREFIKFDEQEGRIYRNMEHRVNSRIQDMQKENTGNYIGYLLLLLRLRQVCDHLSLASGSLTNDDKESVISSIGKDNDKTDEDDLSDLLKDLSIEKNLIQQEDDSFQGEKLDFSDTSSKIRKLLEILRTGESRKTIVFSQFTQMLDLIEPCLRRNNIKYCRYDGSMKPGERDASLNTLRNDKSTTVLLCSLKCGALGLNLTCANRVVLVDPWWNPMISEQAIDRVHRLGQTANVDVHELIVSDSVEERIVKLQNKKRELADSVIEGGSKMAANNKLSTQELLSLFR